MPKSWFWDRIELASEITGAAQVAGLAPEEAGILDALIGRRARVITPLRPFGQIEIDGRLYEARLPLGTVERDATVIVRGCNDFSLDVEPADPTKPTAPTEPTESAAPAESAAKPTEDNA
jgi:membrane-bound serine protease (ClpP class)